MNESQMLWCQTGLPVLLMLPGPHTLNVGYLVGFAHYAMAALTLVADPACWEGGEERRQQQQGAGASRATTGLVVGVALFVGASIEQVGAWVVRGMWDYHDPSFYHSIPHLSIPAQYRCHAALAALRKSSSHSHRGNGNGGGSRRRSGRLAAAGDKDKPSSPPSPPSSSHALPRGHWGFGRVACPHYTCEAVLYLALALLFASSRGGNGTAGLLAVWVAVNLGVTAEKTRRWYRQRWGRCACVYIWGPRCTVWRRCMSLFTRACHTTITGSQGSSRPRARPCFRVFGSVHLRVVSSLMDNK